MKIINKPTTVKQETHPSPPEQMKLLAHYDTFFRAKTDYGTYAFGFFHTGAHSCLVKLGNEFPVGELNRYNNLKFTWKEDALPRLLEYGWTNIELIKDMKLKMELV